MKTILVVDDNKLNLAAARSVLQSEYRVISVMRGEQAITYLESGDCDLILLDINMPDMDGFEVHEKILKMERFHNIPVIFLTADSDPQTETICFKRGAADFIAKPFVPAVMRYRIGRILELEDLRRGLADKLEQKTKEVFDIKNKSRQDALTGLWNRAYTEEMVNGMLTSGVRGALLMIDLDNFKAVNDVYGHIAGDRTLQMFADILREFSSEGDVLCRIGGDEFIVFVKGVTSKEELGARAEKILNRMSRKIRECGFETNTSISIGIAQAPSDGNVFLKLYSSADKALYYVKQNGKNSYHFFTDRLHDGNDSGAKTVDLQYLQDLMSRSDDGTGAYLLNFDNFHHVYNFIRRFVGRNQSEVQTVLFTVHDNKNAEFDVTEAEYALELLEKAVYTSLRRSDVSTRYSSKQLIVILMDTNTENGDMVAERIIENFYKLYTNGKVYIDFGIARMPSQTKK